MVTESIGMGKRQGARLLVFFVAAALISVGHVRSQKFAPPFPIFHHCSLH